MDEIIMQATPVISFTLGIVFPVVLSLLSSTAGTAFSTMGTVLFLCSTLVLVAQIIDIILSAYLPSFLGVLLATTLNVFIYLIGGRFGLPTFRYPFNNSA